MAIFKTVSDNVRSFRVASDHSRLAFGRDDDVDILYLLLPEVDYLGVATGLQAEYLRGEVRVPFDLGYVRHKLHLKLDGLWLNVPYDKSFVYCCLGQQAFRDWLPLYGCDVGVSEIQQF